MKINIALILFYLAYRFALRRLTFYTLNRFFLVSGIVFSSAYPFVDVSDIFRKSAEINNKLIVIVPDWNSVQQVVMPSAAFDYWNLLTIIFWTGVSVMTVRLLIQFISLYRIHRSSRIEAFDDYTFRKVGREINPFSFWKSTYLNPSLYGKEELTAILEHEKIHAQEWHTLDVLLAELSIVFYWFNPGVWLMKQAIKENLEFITDRRVLKLGLDSKAYQYSLVRMIFFPGSPSLVNNFSFISIKKRIMMMNKKQSSQVQISRYLLILPMVILLTLVFTVSKAQLENNSLKRFKKDGISAIHNAVKSVSSIPAIIEQRSKSFTKDDNPIKTEILKNEPEMAGANPISKIDTLYKEKYPRMALYVVDGIITTNIPMDLDNYNIRRVEVLTNESAANSIYGDQNIVRIVIITKYGNDSFLNLGKPGKRPVLIDGKELTKSQLDKITVQDYEDIHFIVDKTVLAKYGEKAKNGILLLSTK